VFINVDTTGLDLSDAEQVQFKRLFKWLLYIAKSPDANARVKGNVIIPLNGNGTVGTVKVESFHDIVQNGKNGDRPVPVPAKHASSGN